MASCNERNCTCPNNACERHGKCCECVNFHRSNKSIVACFSNFKVESK
jgi:hypothetical protein